MSDVTGLDEYFVVHHMDDWYDDFPFENGLHDDGGWYDDGEDDEEDDYAFLEQYFDEFDEDEADILAAEASKKSVCDYVDDTYAGYLKQCNWKGLGSSDRREHMADLYDAIELEVAF